MFKNRTHEEGLTLVELLVVIALVGVVAAIALPIVTNVLAGAQADADTQSADAKTKFVTDWTAAGADLTTTGGKVYAVLNGKTVAQISEGTGDGNNNASTTLTLNATNFGWGSSFYASGSTIYMSGSSEVVRLMRIGVELKQLDFKSDAFQPASPLPHVYLYLYHTLSVNFCQLLM